MTSRGLFSLIEPLPDSQRESSLTLYTVAFLNPAVNQVHLHRHRLHRHTADRSVIVRLQLRWHTQKISKCQKFLPWTQSRSISTEHSPIYIFSPQRVAWPLLSLCYHSGGALEPFIPIIMTSSGTWRRRLQGPSCLVKDFSSCETVKSGAGA